ncbi:HEPN domain-containing protein [Rhodoferax sp.]|uniref:HEPN domain-containing protein n=1 Tax=Rhodoferax sp. TaxID=50421 RepID=UPI002ACE1D17|nr:HEPN domain-containing protein [Rhodoferax sp.]MDZ7919604.1 HEPN domain-containing protein [Rhodoferax sp.]
MNEHDLMVKAQRALASARTLLADGDNDGACNRAYYAMFDAARGALLASKAPVSPEVAKTHSGLISAFSLHLVKLGKFPVELGKSFNKAEDLRLIADYKGDPLDTVDALWVVEQAAVFVGAIQDSFFS